ncbi:hypothetical protein L1286_23930 [Pseudoalteromonas sp. SMS1]|uniref:hypothetical protein n=1 Tax=Pseudoalteromonas sp. SMS1 TaxID=2908894 RepID=UPI001F3044F2|nr:hypothetical protein [Pseudoalteromonas sp. SMS1]MCF2860516.1 hypothetical protein [Pseudoalteromonas sp. SMS1]
MLSRSDNNELINFFGVFAVGLFIGGAILIRPYFDSVRLQAYISIFLSMLFLFVIGGFYFNKKSKLAFSFLCWQCLLSMTYLAYLSSIIVYIWGEFGGGSLGLSVLIISIATASLCGFLIRALEPMSNFRAGITKGRFKPSTFSFDSSVWQKDVSEANPILIFFGFKKKEGDSFQSTIRKGGTWSAIAASLAIIMQTSGNGALFEVLILTLGAVAFGYMFSFNYIADFFFCLKAGFSKEK